jgi:hypothetical protein
MFLTQEDPRAKIQGSRDPLGLQPIWASFGRRVVTNLTSTTTSVRGFTTHMLARYFGERLVEAGDAREHEVLGIFLRMEQIAAYARHLGEEGSSSILGVQRVTRFLADGARVNIQTDPSGFILSDQKVYGLWGLYTVSARVSGLASEGPFGLTSRARDFVENTYVPMLRPSLSKLRALLLRGGKLDTRRNAVLFRSLLDIFTPELTPEEGSFFGSVLRDAEYVDGPAREGRQALFADLLRKLTDLDAWTGREELLRVAMAARASDEGLAHAIERLVRLEALLAPAEMLFGHLQARNEQRPADIARKLADHWGGRVPHLGDGACADLLDEIGHVTSPDAAQLLHRCDSTLGAGDYGEAIEALLDLNKLVMHGRRAAPWVRLNSGKLDVRYRGQERELPDGDRLPTLWRNSYFIDALKTICRQIDGAAA